MGSFDAEFFADGFRIPFFSWGNTFTHYLPDGLGGGIWDSPGASRRETRFYTNLNLYIPPSESGWIYTALILQV